MKTRTEKAAETRARLLNAARKLFSEKGFEGSRSQEIADLATANKAMINYHFQGKLGLFTAVIREDLESISGELSYASTQGETPWERLENFLGTLGRTLSRHKEFARIMTREQMTGAGNLDPELRREFFAIFGLQKEILVDGMADGSFRDIDPHATHLAIVGSLVFHILTEPARDTYLREGQSPANDLPWPHYVDHVRSMVLRGLSPGPKPK